MHRPSGTDRLMQLLLVLLFFCLLSAAPVAAATYYVDASQGEDDPAECDVPRDPAKPFLTINGAINQHCQGLEDSDTVIVSRASTPKRWM